MALLAIGPAASSAGSMVPVVPGPVCIVVDVMPAVPECVPDVPVGGLIQLLFQPMLCLACLMAFLTHTWVCLLRLVKLACLACMMCRACLILCRVRQACLIVRLCHTTL